MSNTLATFSISVTVGQESPEYRMFCRRQNIRLTIGVSSHCGSSAIPAEPFFSFKSTAWGASLRSEVSDFPFKISTLSFPSAGVTGGSYALNPLSGRNKRSQGVQGRRKHTCEQFLTPEENLEVPSGLVKNGNTLINL